MQHARFRIVTPKKLWSWLAVWIFVGLAPGQSSEPKFRELTPADRERLARQRAVVLAVVKQRYRTAAFARSRKDLPILQRLLDEKAFSKSQFYELQSSGVVFGDVLASELPLRWVMISDEFGTDPTLRFKNTSININALTIISKRVERDENVDLEALLGKTRDALAAAEKKFR